MDRPSDSSAAGSRAGDRAEPLDGTIPAFATAEAARRRLERETIRYLIVVAPGTGRMLGAVDRESLARGACCDRADPSCAVVHHLAPGVAFCFAEEDAADVASNEAELAAKSGAVRPRRIFMVVVDRELVPLGILAPEHRDRPAATGSRAA